MAFNRGSKILIKCAGGAASQCLALMNALYLRNRLDRDFIIKYYPHSTGTYWPFAIDFLVAKDEVLSDTANIRGLDIVKPLEVGKIIREHPLATQGFSYEKFLAIIRRFNLEPLLVWFRGERVLSASTRKLNRVNRRVRSVSGGFVPILDKNVFSEMNLRFEKSGINSPFSKVETSRDSKNVVIHYRIGDKRAKFSHPSEFGSDGIVDPLSFHGIIEKLNLNGPAKFTVVSDEPKIAKLLLSDVGVHTKLNPKLGNLWEDLFIMSQADIFIGSWSQVSQLAALCVINNGGIAFLPSTTQVGTKVNWEIPAINYYVPKFLPEEHPIYSPEFTLDSDSHSAYKSLNK